MICHRIELAAQAKNVLEGLPAVEIESALASVARFKSRLVPPDAFSEAASSRWMRKSGTCAFRPWARRCAAQRSPEDGKRSPVELHLLEQHREQRPRKYAREMIPAQNSAIRNLLEPGTGIAGRAVGRGLPIHGAHHFQIIVKAAGDGDGADRR